MSNITKFTQNRAISVITITAISAILLAWVPSTVYGASPTLVEDCTGDSTTDGQRLVLTKDINNWDLGDCILINHNNVTFDCKGFTIDGTNVANSDGIRIGGDNVKVKNCNITDFKFGLVLTGNGATLTGNTLSSNLNGIDLAGNDNKLRSNESSSNNANGIEIRSGSTGNRLDRNSFDDNASSGIIMSNSDDNSFNANTANRNAIGINLLNDSDNNTFKRNITNENTQDGFRIDNTSDFNIFTANTSNNNDLRGILDQSGGSNTYQRNMCSGNGDDSNPNGLCN